MLASIAAAHGAQHVETLTGFKWLARADADLPGSTLVYAYEEAIGHCVDPSAVRDKDGISAAVLACDLVAALRDAGRTALRRAGCARPAPRRAHDRRACPYPPTRRLMAATPRRHRPDRSGRRVGPGRRSLRRRTDALIYTGESVRVAVRPSGTEPKVKAYLEIRLPPRDDVAAARGEAAPNCLDELRADVVESASARPELTVSRIAEARHDVGDVVEPVVDGGGVERAGPVTPSPAPQCLPGHRPRRRR